MRTLLALLAALVAGLRAPTPAAADARQLPRDLDAGLQLALARPVGARRDRIHAPQGQGPHEAGFEAMVVALAGTDAPVELHAEVARMLGLARDRRSVVQ